MNVKYLDSKWHEIFKFSEIKSLKFQYKLNFKILSSENANCDEKFDVNTENFDEKVNFVGEFRF